MTPSHVVILGMLFAYLLGSIPFGVLIGRLKGVDIRRGGSGNTGATNAFRLLGRRMGLLVFFLDVSKGFVPTFIAGMVLRDSEFALGMSLWAVNVVWVLIGLSSIVGHMASVFLRFRGGKGVATSLGVAISLYPDLTYPGLACLVMWMIIVLMTRVVSIASLGSAIAFPLLVIIFAYWTDGDVASRWPMASFALLMSGMIVWRHRPNISRLLAGSEPEIGLSNKKIQ